MKHCPHCLSEIGAASKVRSGPQLRRFFAVLRAMYAHWPEDCSFQPHSEEHLRKWATCMAGHREVIKTMTLPQTDNPSLAAAMMATVEALLEMDGRIGRWKGMTFSAYQAKSIAFHKLSQSEFNKLNDEVEAVYASETGLDPETVLREHEQTA